MNTNKQHTLWLGVGGPATPGGGGGEEEEELKILEGWGSARKKVKEQGA